jgi:hypothetical protein
MPNSIQLRAFGGTGEPCIFLARDAWDRGLIVPAYSKGTLRRKSAGISMAEGKEPKSAYPPARGYVAYSNSMKRSILSLDKIKQLKKIYIFLLLWHILIVRMFFGNIVIIKSSSKQKAFFDG